MTPNKKRLIIVSALLTAGMTVSLMHKVYAAKPVISLSSPVSFPVDI